MSGDEDEAGAVHDDAGEVHSDGPGGVGEAGVVYAPVHPPRHVHHGGGRQQSREHGGHAQGCIQGGTAICTATPMASRALCTVTIWRVPEVMCVTRGHAWRGGQRVAGSKTSQGQQWPRFVWWPQYARL
jgi:hypothetical protein